MGSPPYIHCLSCIQEDCGNLYRFFAGISGVVDDALPQGLPRCALALLASVLFGRLQTPVSCLFFALGGLSSYQSGRGFQGVVVAPGMHGA